MIKKKIKKNIRVVPNKLFVFVGSHGFFLSHKHTLVLIIFITQLKEIHARRNMNEKLLEKYGLKFF